MSSAANPTGALGPSGMGRGGMGRGSAPDLTRPETPNLWPRIASLFSGYKPQIAVITVIIVITSLLGVIGALLVKRVFDVGLQPANGESVNLPVLIPVVIALMLIPLASGALNVTQSYLTNVVGNRVMRDLREQLYNHLQKLSLAFFTGTRTGEMQSRLANDVGGVQTTITSTASSVVSNIVVVVSSMVAMFILSVPLTILSLILVPVFVVASRRVGRRRRSARRDAQISLSEMTAITQETLSVSGVLLSKVFGRQQHEIDRYSAENARQVEVQVRQAMTGRTFFALTQAFFGLSPALIYLVAGITAYNGHTAISAGTLVAFTALQTRLLMPINQLLQVSVDVQSSAALFARIFDYLDLDPAIVARPDAVALDPTEVQGRIELDNVRFKYGRSERDPEATPEELASAERAPWALDGISLEVEPGQLAALVGPSGAGKTTVSYLVPRLYDVTEGAVRIDGHDLRDLTLESIAATCGVVTQESYLFHGTVAENLRYGSPDATDEQLVAASKAAFIHERIVALDSGYDTVVGERGYRFSGGERQRLAIARVLLKDPKILILDEATSALDTTSERIVQQALDTLMKDRTAIVIAHRLSTIRAADVIFAMDKGKVVERGTHDELVAAGGLYAQLYEEQFGGGEVEAFCSDGVVLSSGQIARSSAHA